MTTETPMQKTNIYSKITTLKNKLANADIQKSGYNAFSKFKYYELKDFLPHLNKFCEELNLCHQFYFVEGSAVISFIDTEEQSSKNHFSVPIPQSLIESLFSLNEKTKQSNQLQTFGAMLTYIKRYAYLTALDLCENDLTDDDQRIPTNPPARPLDPHLSKTQIDTQKKDLSDYPPAVQIDEAFSDASSVKDLEAKADQYRSLISSFPNDIQLKLRINFKNYKDALEEAGLWK